MNHKLGNGQRITSHGIITIPKSPEVIYRFQEQKTVKIMWIMSHISLVIVIGFFLWLLNNIELIKSLPLIKTIFGV